MVLLALISTWLSMWNVQGVVVGKGDHTEANNRHNKQGREGEKKTD